MALIGFKTARSPAGMHDPNMAYRMDGTFSCGSVRYSKLRFAQLRINVLGIVRSSTC